jgi:polyisoprenoid-binding protein YceI
MTTRTLLVGVLALGLAACGGETDAPATATDVPVTPASAELPAVPAGTYAIDPAHSRAEFRVRHLGISTVTGRFGDVDGTLTVGDDLSTLDATAVIDASTIDTGNDRRDGHLQSADFFDVAQHPEITFQSTEIRPAEDGGFVLVGDLTMRGVTRPVELEAEYIGAAAMGDTQKIGFSARGEITRQDWGLDWAETNEAGEALVGDEVELVIEVEADRQDVVEAETVDADA